MPFLLMDTFFLFLTLCMLEVVLGVDNIIAFSMIVNQAPQKSRQFVKLIGLTGAFFLRVVFSLSVLRLQNIDAHFNFLGFALPWKNILFITGGVFLIYKSILELNTMKLSNEESELKQQSNLLGIILSIIFIDIVFAVDSVLVAIAMTQNYAIIVSSILASMFFMYLMSDCVICYMAYSWRIKVLGMLLVLMIGLFLFIKGCGIHLDQELIIAMVFFGCCYEALTAYIENKSRNRT